MVYEKDGFPNGNDSRLSGPSLPTMMITFEKAIHKSMTVLRRSVHHTNFLWAFCQESSSAPPPNGL